jgi:osmoprotectant transport system substrate-binding protein
VRRTDRRLAFCLAALLLLIGCDQGPVSQGSVLDDDSLTVGSFDFPESVLLAELYAQALASRGIAVDRELAVGPRELVMPALERGLLEVVPEYTGSALAFFGGSVSGDAAETAARLQTELADRDLRALEPAKAQDQNGFAVTDETANELGVRALSDLVTYAPRLRFGGPPECTERPLCLAGLESVYGLRFADAVTLDAGGPLTLQALRNDLVDVALLFTTDGSLTDPGLVLLADDRGLQPPEQVVPIARARSLARFGPEAVEALNSVSSELTTIALRTMNAEVAHGRPPSDVAHDWLVDRGLLTED